MKKEAGKFLWNLLDRFMFIGIGVIGTVATTYITGMFKVNSPELVVAQTYNRVDTGPVANDVGGLKIEYKSEPARPYGIRRARRH